MTPRPKSLHESLTRFTGWSHLRPCALPAKYECELTSSALGSQNHSTKQNKAHVYQVSPALTVVEKTTGKALANLFGFTGPLAGGVTCPGGSASNLTSMIVARNTLFPDSKTRGNRHRDYVVFTSAHGHYSVEKNAMICGMGSDSVWTVPVDDDGCMKTTALRERIVEAKEAGKTPFYVNSTAGTTVLGSFEAFEEISQICKEFGLWMHIDASWGGPVIFSPTHRGKMKGSHLAHSITINPHKMMNVPLTCSFLLAQDMSIVKQANRTEAGYLFHGSDDDEIWDLADLSLQCGRRADSLKLALAWIYYGTDGFASQVDHAFEMASYLFKLVKESGNFNLVSREPPPCLQVCFYHAPSGKLSESPDSNTRRTKCVVAELVVRGFMVDFAPGEKGSFFRVVVNTQTLPSTLDGLVAAIVEIGKGIDHII